MWSACGQGLLPSLADSRDYCSPLLEVPPTCRLALSPRTRQTWPPQRLPFPRDGLGTVLHVPCAPAVHPSYSGTSSERPRHYGEQPHVSTPRHSKLGADPNEQHTTNRILEDYALSKTLGAGSMGKVKLGHHNITGEKVCTPTILFLHRRSCVARSLPSKFFPASSRFNPSVPGSPNAEVAVKQMTKDASKEIRAIREAALSRSFSTIHTYAACER
ncbi:hypothetical protein BC826DRAFT_1106553 [Russula brevipes]|nr:hypothetical protein BC826DRAFT_1106553 [Russula brevipes]